MARAHLSWRRAAALVVMATFSAGCAGGAGGLSGPPPLRSGPAVNYVAIGEELPSSVTDPRGLWQDLFVQSALPVWTTSYLVALPPDWQIDTSSAVSHVAALSPTVVSVEVGFEEAVEGQDVTGFSASLRQLLAALKGMRVRTILVANLPPAPQQSNALPTATTVAAYDRAVASDCRAAGAVLVDIHGALAVAMSDGKTVSGGSALTAVGQVVVADAFKAAARGRPLSLRGRRSAGGTS